MHRIIIRLGPLTVYAYGVMLALAFIAGTMLAKHRARRQGLSQVLIMDMVFYILITSVVGARLFFVALNLDYYRTRLLDMFKLWEGGLVFYGGLITGFFVALWFLRSHKIPFWKAADIFAPSLALGNALGRLGCFLNGCCYGTVSSLWGVCFPSKDTPPVFMQQVMDGLIPSTASHSLPVLPTQLYDALSNLFICAFLLWLDKRKRFEGELFLVFVALYSLGRFFIEGMRYYETQYMAFGTITVSQVISLLLLAVSCFLLVYKWGARSLGNESSAKKKKA